jgi:hypothetical protein
MPWDQDRRAEFTTIGGTLFVTAYGFSHGGILDPEVAGTAIYFGLADQPPTWDRQTNPSNLQAEIFVVEDDFTKVDLPAGRYWVLTSNGANVAIVSCEEDGVSDPLVRFPAPSHDPTLGGSPSAP